MCQSLQTWRYESLQTWRYDKCTKSFGWTSLPTDPSRGEQQQTKDVACPRNHLCARHHRVARIERPFGFGGEPVITPAVGRPGQRRASDHHHPGSAAASRWRSRSTATTRTRSRAGPSTAAKPAAPRPRPTSCWRHRRSRRRTGHVRRRDAACRHGLGRQRQSEPDHAGELGQLTFGVLPEWQVGLSSVSPVGVILFGESR
jgi:hypothetical protein